MALGSLGKLFVSLGVDTKDLEKGIGKAKGDISGLGAAFQKHGKAIGAALTVAGAGLTALTDSSLKTNAALGTTALQLGISTKEMRALAIETANVTFPLSEVQASFDLLTRAGMTNADQIAASATAFDTLGDAIGLPASEVTRSLIPAFNAFGIPLEDAAANTDMLTHLMRNTTVELSAFANMVNRLSPDLATMDLSMQEAVAVMEALADKGIQGTAATLEFRTAVSSADGDVNKFYEALGLTADEVATYTENVEASTGMTQEFADAQNKQFSTMDKIKHSLSEMTLKYGSLLQPLEALGPIMMTLGPAMLLAATLPLPAMAAHAVAAWAAIAPYLVIIAPILAVIAVLAILELKFGFVTKAISILSGVFGPLISGIKGFLGIANDAADAAEAVAWAVEQEASMMGAAEIAADALAEAQKNVADSAGEVDVLTSAYEELQGAISDALGLTEDVDDQARAVEHATFGLADAEAKYADAVAEHGANSDEAARADLRRRDAVDRLDDAQKKQIKLTEELADADSKATGILKANNADSLSDLESMLHDKQTEHENFQDQEIIALAAHGEAIAALEAHQADMEIAEQKRAQAEQEETAKKSGDAWDGALRAILGPIGFGIIALEKLEKKFGLVTKTTDVVQTAFDEVSGWLSEAIPTAIDTTVGYIEGLGDKLSFLLDPIGAVIDAFKNWDKIVGIVGGVFTKVWDKITGLDRKFKDAGKALMVALAKGIIAGISDAVDAVKRAAAKVMEYLPFSDAKRGPLSNITASGAALMTTFEKGIASSSVDLAHTVEHILPDMSAILPDVTYAAGIGDTLTNTTINDGANVSNSVMESIGDTISNINTHEGDSVLNEGDMVSNSSLQTIGDTISNIISSIGDTINNATSIIGDTITNEGAVIHKYETIHSRTPSAPPPASSNTTNSSSISMGDVNLSNDFDFEALMAQINRYQAQQRTQRGAV